MKKNIDVRSLLVGVLLGAVAIIGVAAANNHNTVWEYKLIGANYSGKGEELRQMNAAAEEGWEAIAATAVVDMPVFLLKRAKK